jgi:hypothetical protein
MVSVNYHNHLIGDAVPDGAPIIVASGVSAYDGTHWIKEERQPGRKEYRPRIFDRDEINRLARIRVSNALLATSAGADIDQKYFSDIWQRRQVRKENRQDYDMWSMSHGWIGHDKNHVIHPQLIEDRKFQKVAWKKFAASRILTAKDGTMIDLQTVMDTTVKNRKNELYVIVKGIQKVAEADSLTWGMLTLSCPPRFHPRPKNGHSTWDGSTPKDAHKWLHDEWRGVLRRLDNQGIHLSGVRFVEYHQDGCPHWHVLFYTDDLPELMKEVRKAWPTEAAADFVIGDPAKGSFATYCMSYLMADESSPHILQYDAKRAVWAQRFYQFFGVPRIGLWRAARAMTEAPGDDALADAIWRAARRGDGAAFISLNGGLAVANKDRPVSGRIVSTPAPNQTKTAIIKTDIETFSCPLQTYVIEGVAVIPNYPRNPDSDHESDEFVKNEPSKYWERVGYVPWEPPERTYKPPRQLEYQKFTAPKMSAADQAACREFMRVWNDLYPEQVQ